MATATLDDLLAQLGLGDDAGQQQPNAQSNPQPQAATAADASSQNSSPNLLGLLGNAAKSLLALPTGVLNGYASAYGDIPNQIAFQQKQRQYQALAQRLSYLSALKRMQLAGQMSGDGSAGQGPGAGGALPNQRGPLAGMAMLDDKPGDAWNILKGDYAQAADGTLYDKTSGQPIGRLPSPSFQNDRVIDLGDPNNVGKFFGKPPAPGAEPVFDSNQQQVGWRLADGTIQSVQQNAQAAATGTGAGQATYAGVIAGKEAAAKAPFTPVQVDNNGVPTTITAAQLPQLAGGPRGGGGTPPAPTATAAAVATPPGSAPSIAASLPKVGQAPVRPAATAANPGIAGMGPSDAEFAKDQGQEASKSISADLDARAPAMEQLGNAKQALAYVQSHPGDMNPATPHLVAGANYLRALPTGVLKAAGVDPKNVDAYANNAAVYQRLASQNLLSFSKANLPARYTEREMAVASKVIPQLSTAPDAASFHWGLQAATADKAITKANFAANYNGPKTKQAIEQAWSASQDGQASLFQDPIWQNIQISGKPAVTQFQHQGQTYGAIGAGTGHPVFFKWAQ